MFFNVEALIYVTKILSRNAHHRRIFNRLTLILDYSAAFLEAPQYLVPAMSRVVGTMCMFALRKLRSGYISLNNTFCELK